MLHFSVIRVCSNILICQQASECLMQRTMLAAVHPTDEQLIASRHLMQISALLAFFYTKCALLVCKTVVALYWSFTGQ